MKCLSANNKPKWLDLTFGGGDLIRTYGHIDQSVWGNGGLPVARLHWLGRNRPIYPDSGSMAATSQSVGSELGSTGLRSASGHHHWHDRELFSLAPDRSHPSLVRRPSSDLGRHA